ncbi:MAG: hypothetical protein K0U78_14300 [Actinomycetia bacterium]|nr:hypothetical protein [Actinomycetes bacterium]
MESIRKETVFAFRIQLTKEPSPSESTDETEGKKHVTVSNTRKSRLLTVQIEFVVVGRGDVDRFLSLNFSKRFHERTDSVQFSRSHLDLHM